MCVCVCVLWVFVCVLCGCVCVLCVCVYVSKLHKAYKTNSALLITIVVIVTVIIISTTTIIIIISIPRKPYIITISNDQALPKSIFLIHSKLKALCICSVFWNSDKKLAFLNGILMFIPDDLQLREVSLYIIMPNLTIF